MNMQLKISDAPRARLVLAAFGMLSLACASPTFAQVKPAIPAKPAAPRPAPAPAPQPAQPAQPVAQPGQPPAPGTGDAAAPSPQPPDWVSRCASDGRQGALECAVEQTVYLSKTGQLVAAVTVRVPSDTHQPSMGIQVPVGLYLPAGVSVKVDDGKPLALVLQTCDLKGCYAATQVSPELLAQLKAGKTLTITFQNLTKENISIPLQLTNFARAYEKIQ